MPWHAANICKLSSSHLISPEPGLTALDLENLTHPNYAYDAYVSRARLRCNCGYCGRHLGPSRPSWDGLAAVACRHGHAPFLGTCSSGSMEPQHILTNTGHPADTSTGPCWPPCCLWTSRCPRLATQVSVGLYHRTVKPESVHFQNKRSDPHRAHGVPPCGCVQKSVQSLCSGMCKKPRESKVQGRLMISVPTDFFRSVHHIGCDESRTSKQRTNKWLKLRERNTVVIAQ